MTELIIGGLFLCLFAWREYRHDAERRDLYTRIQARDLSEYTHSVGSRPPPRSRNVIAAGLRRYYGRKVEAGDK